MSSTNSDFIELPLSSRTFRENTSYSSYNRKIVSSSKRYAKCYECKKSVKCSKSIIKTSHAQDSSLIGNNKIDPMSITHTTHSIFVICDECFDENMFAETTNYDCGLFLYSNSGRVYVNKKEFKKFAKSGERKQKLAKKLKELKLTFTKNKICEEYINFGTPDLDTVIKSLLSKQNLENDRLCILLETLKKKKLEYDAKIPVYAKYIKKGGEIDKVIENGELERLLIKETNYLAVLDMTDSDTAKEIAMCSANKKSKNTGLFDKYILKKNTVRFD